MGKKGKGAARPPVFFNTTHRSPYCATEGLRPTFALVRYLLHSELAIFAGWRTCTLFNNVNNTNGC